ncbi:MAG: SurA N-terminal domain-containing protein [Methylocystaceae bacterium]|nr:SurA N-terminal domain-containing protein [Methylocystaceae bacterium]
MLDGFRKHSNSIIVKALFFLLIASFAAWGIGDMLRPAATGNSVATVGNVDISAQEVFNDFQREMSRMRQLTGDQGVNEQLSLAIGSSVVDRAINKALMSVSAKDMDVAISDEQVVKSIRETPMFQENGVFNRQRFEQILFSNQLNENQFIELVRGDLAREQIVSLMESGSSVPESVVKELYKHRQEKRSASVVRIDRDSVGDVAAPSTEEVRKYYDDNINKFMAPEYRSVSLLHITPKDVADTIDVPLQKVEDAYAAHQSEFVTPGHRIVEQMVFTTEEEAKAAAQSIADGKSFADVAKDLLGLEKDALLLGDVTKAELPEELADPVFALGKDEVSAPIQSMLGWHIVHVTQVTDEVVASFDDVKDKLHDQVALEMAADELFSISNTIEDTLGGGATIEEAAKKVGFKVSTIEATDKTGKDTSGAPIAALAGQKALLEEIFAVDIATEPTMKDDDQGGYFMVRVDGITESTARAFETVQESASAQLLDQKKQAAAKEKATSIVAAVKSGKQLADLAKESGLEVTEKTGFTRFDAPLPASVTTALFAGKVGDVESGADEKGFVVAVLKDIQSMEGDQDQAAINALSREMAAGIKNDMEGEFVNALRGRYSVSIDRGMVNRLFVQEQR